MHKTRNSNVSKGGCMRFYLHYDDIDEAEIAENIIRSYGIKPEVTTKNIFGFYDCQICIDTSLEFFDYMKQEIAKKIQKYKVQEEKRNHNIKFLESCLTKDKVKEIMYRFLDPLPIQVELWEYDFNAESTFFNEFKNSMKDINSMFGRIVGEVNSWNELLAWTGISWKTVQKEIQNHFKIETV